MSDLNQYTCTARLGADPESRFFNNGDPVTNMRVAVSKSWKKDGQKQEKTLWLPVIITNKNLCKIAGDYLKKGSKVALSGELQSRSYEKDGNTVWVTELVLGPFNSVLTMLDGKQSSEGSTGSQGQDTGSSGGGDFLDDDIAF